MSGLLYIYMHGLLVQERKAQPCGAPHAMPSSMIAVVCFLWPRFFLRRAPEQFAPGCRTTNKVDVWGFAATLLHMITGSPPWQHDTLMQICTAVGVAKQAPPLPEGLPGPLQALMATCFEPDPARRPTAVYLLKVLYCRDCFAAACTMTMAVQQNLRQ